MILIKPSAEILSIMNYKNPLELIEESGRTCYKSPKSETYSEQKAFIKRILTSGHESVIEHSCASVRFIVDRGVSHEIVRHRLASYSQESTRYCNYKGGVIFILPPWVNIKEQEIKQCNSMEVYHSDADGVWLYAMAESERRYLRLLENKWSPQQARSVLPNSLKTELVMTANFREWRHFLKLRTSNKAHPQIREVAIPLLKILKKKVPVIFDNIEGEI